MRDQKLTLVILAAGLGSRFGGDKQLANLGPNNETMLELSLLSAYKAGFQKAVLVIRPELESALNSRLKTVLPQNFDYQFCYQNIDDLPLLINTCHRQKPWGTAHALYAARKQVKGAMAVINADDYYGDDAFLLLANELMNSRHWTMVAYPINHTLSEFGGVNRGICEIQNNQLINIAEWTNIAIDINKQTLFGTNNNHRQMLPADTLVSMTCWGFQQNIFTILSEYLSNFILLYGDQTSKECYLPDVVQFALEQQQKLVVKSTTENWLGVTYPEDALMVKSKLKQLPL